MRTGLIVFAVGVAVNYLAGESFRLAALVIQVVGAVLLFANAARSRRRAAGGDEPDAT